MLQIAFEEFIEVKSRMGILGFCAVSKRTD
jgi:hypothetical protein